MTHHRIQSTLLIYFTICLLLTVHLHASAIHHDLSVTIDPANHHLSVLDRITIPDGSIPIPAYFLLHGNLNPVLESPDLALKHVTGKPKAGHFGLESGSFSWPAEFPIEEYRIRHSLQESRDLIITLRYDGTIDHPLEEVSEEYARGFSTTPGIISTDGVFLAGSTYWIPWFGDSLVTFRMTVHLPESWDAVSQGDRTFQKRNDQQRTVIWESTKPMDEIFLIAAPFTEYQHAIGDISVMAFLRTPDESLAAKYLETTAQYLTMYENLIGPYPYSKFALIENFWETGYGMPSFTLLGSQIIRFPFILHSSYPHELLHNWWGNSVYVNYESGNWCEGLTAYLADHLIQEQRGQGIDYRRTTLQKYTDYVKKSSDFPLTEFTSRTSAATEAVGYGKSLMLFHMLRQILGDDSFRQFLQTFYKTAAYTRASFADIQKTIESVTGESHQAFFDQWVKRTGAPELMISDVAAQKGPDTNTITFTLSQVQAGDPYDLKIPIAIHLMEQPTVYWTHVNLTQSTQSFTLPLPSQPFRIDVDPEFDVFRTLHRDEIPPSLSKAFGSESAIILLPGHAEPPLLEAYRTLAETWSGEKKGTITILTDTEVPTLPRDKTIWLFGWENTYASQAQTSLSSFDVERRDAEIRVGTTTIPITGNSFVFATRNPDNPDHVIIHLASDRPAALTGLARKLPHYGKYSYLAFEGDEPVQIAKGQWPTIGSPMSMTITSPETPGDIQSRTFPDRRALAQPAPVFSEERLMAHVNTLAGPEMEGRGLFSDGIEKAADYIADRFAECGLLPGGDPDSYFQSWSIPGKKPRQHLPLKNVIGILPGTNPAWVDQSVILCAHYDHLGIKNGSKKQGSVNEIYPGADDNASGVAVMLELACALSKTLEPRRTIIFIAFTGEETGFQGSNYYISHCSQYPVLKILGVVNLDSVGRLGTGKPQILGSSSAEEWKHIVMGAGFVTGIESELVSQELESGDHIRFIQNSVPGIQIFSGAHMDYHKVSDTPDKIDPSGMTKIASIASEIVRYLSERAEPLTGRDAQSQKISALTETDRKTSMGIMPDFKYTGTGVKIGGIFENSPALKAGLHLGDVIVQVGEYKIETLREYADVLKGFKPGDKTKITVARDGALETLEIILGAR